VIKTSEVAGAAYSKKQLDEGNFLSHAYDTVTGSPICKRVKPEHIIEYCGEGEDSRPTCPVCAKKDPRK
jgi:hypothetical protein